MDSHRIVNTIIGFALVAWLIACTFAFKYLDNLSKTLTTLEQTVKDGGDNEGQ